MASHAHVTSDGGIVIPYSIAKRLLLGVERSHKVSDATRPLRTAMDIALRESPGEPREVGAIVLNRGADPFVNVGHSKDPDGEYFVWRALRRHELKRWDQFHNPRIVHRGVPEPAQTHTGKRLSRDGYARPDEPTRPGSTVLTCFGEYWVCAGERVPRMDPTGPKCRWFHAVAESRSPLASWVPWNQLNQPVVVRQGWDCAATSVESIAGVHLDADDALHLFCDVLNTLRVTWDPPRGANPLGAEPAVATQQPRDERSTYRQTGAEPLPV